MLFVWLMVAMVVVVAGVALAVLGSSDAEGGPARGGLADAEPDRIADELPLDRPVAAADVVALRLPLGARGYRMSEVDHVLDRLATELAERDARIAGLERALAAAQAVAVREDTPPGA